MNIGKAYYIFNRSWAWFSRLSVILNTAGIAYLVFQRKDIVLFYAPFLFFGIIFLTILDLKFVLPKELQYGRLKDPEYVRFSRSVESKLDELEKKIGALK